MTSELIARWLFVILVASALTGASSHDGHATTRGAPKHPRCRGVVVLPSTNLPRAVAVHGPNTVFCITAGEHRLRSFVVPKDGDRFIGVPGAVLNGSVVLTGFTQTGSIWGRKLHVSMNPVVEGSCSAGRGDTCQYANDVYFDDRPLRRVDAFTDLRANRFYIGSRSNTLYLAQDPNGHQVEIGVATRAFKGWGTGVEDVTIQGLDVEKFANEFGIAAINARQSWRVLDCTVRLNHGTGIQDAGLIKGNVVADNGQLGIGGSYNDGQRVEYNVIERNNYAGFDPGNEAGGAKWVRSKNLLVSHNVVRDNVGPGLWTDGDSINVVYADNLVVGNTGPGIFHEISWDATISGNTLTDNQTLNTPGQSCWHGAQVDVTDSQNVTVSGNTITASNGTNAVCGIDGTRSEPAPFSNRLGNLYVHDNTIYVTATGLTGATGDYSAPLGTTKFEHNSYFVKAPGGLNWQWMGATVSFAGWQADGFDLTGSIGTGARPGTTRARP